MSEYKVTMVDIETNEKEVVDVVDLLKECKTSLKEFQKVADGRDNLFSRYFQVNIVLFNNLLNGKHHLLKNNLNLLKHFRDIIVERTFDIKEEVTDQGYKHTMEFFTECFDISKQIVNLWAKDKED